MIETVATSALVAAVTSLAVRRWDIRNPGEPEIAAPQTPEVEIQPAVVPPAETPLADAYDVIGRAPSWRARKRELQQAARKKRRALEQYREMD